MLASWKYFMASLASGKDSLLSLGKGPDRYIIYMVGFPPLCYWVFHGMVFNSSDDQTM